MAIVRKTHFKLQEYLPYRLAAAAHSVSRLIARAYEDRFDLTVPEWRLIAVLAEEGGLTQQSLCGRTIMDKVMVMRAAQGLIKRRLVNRLPNSQDGRSHRLELSKTGLDLFANVAPLALQYEAQLLSGMKSSEVDVLHRWLRKLEQAASIRTEDRRPAGSHAFHE